MIEITGAADVRIRYTGLRPGERLHETLFEEGEQRTATDHPMVFRLIPESSASPELLALAEETTFLAREGNDEGSLDLLKRYVPNYVIAEK
jgi:FlaA1/EpsC-like NDP-sugar epimerase